MRLALADLRDSWVAWVGVSLTFVVANAALALSALVAVSGLAAADAGILSGAESGLVVADGGINVVLVSLVGLAVIGASTGLVITSRRSAIARLLLAGATPGQVTRLITTQLVVVSLACAVVGDVIALVGTQPALDLVSEDRGLPVVPAERSLGALLSANLACVGLSALGGLRQAARASRIPPVEAMREATGAARERSGVLLDVLRGLVILVVVGALVAMFPGYRAIQDDLAEDALAVLLQLSMFAVPLAGLGLALVLPWVLAPVTRLWTGLVPVRSASWHLARHTAVAKANRLVRSVIPVMFAVGLFFGMMAVGNTLKAVLVERGIVLEGSSVTTLVTIIGLALAVAIAGSVGNLVMMSRQRAAELALDGVIGATPRQQVMVPVLEAVIVSVTAVLLGLAMSAVGAGLLAFGLAATVPGAQMAMPWAVLGVSAAVCTVVVVLATVLPVLRTLREPAPRVISRLVAA